MTVWKNGKISSVMQYKYISLIPKYKKCSKCLINRVIQLLTLKNQCKLFKLDSRNCDWILIAGNLTLESQEYLWKTSNIKLIYNFQRINY